MRTEKTIYLTDKQVAERYSVARCTVWRWVKKEGFPAPVKLTEGCTRWRDGDVDAWEQRQGV